MNYPTKTRRTTFILFFLIFSINLSIAQKFGKIDMNRLEETAHPTDPDASHAFILRNSHVYYDLDSPSPRIITEYHYRVKIYTEDGLDQANIVRFVYRNGSDREAIRNVKAECYNLVNGKKEKSKLSKKGIFKEEIDENTIKYSFAIPNVRPGSIIEYKFRYDSPFLYAIPRHYFQTEVPVEFSRLKVDVPDYFSMAPSATGMIPLDRKEEKKTSFGASVTQFTFEANDVPGIEETKYVLDIEDYRSSLKFELSQIAYPGQQSYSYTKDWNSICKNLMDADAFGRSMDKKVKPAKEMLDQISALSDQEKLAQIVDFINKNIVWNGELGKYGSIKYKKLFEAKTGNVAEINLLLINLCKRAGLSAEPILTKYRFSGLLNTGYPSLTEINYVFALVQVDGNQIFVDATSPYFEPCTLPLRALNVAGVLVHEKGSEVISLSNTNLNYHRQAGKYSFNMDENRLEGEGKNLIKGYASVKARKKLKEEDDDEDQQEIVKELDDEEDENDEEDDDDELEDVYTYSDSKGFENKYGKISSAYNAMLYSPLESIGDEIYVDAFVTLEFEENPFLDEARNYPAFFNSKHHFNHISILEIPEGHAVKSVPENLSMKIINDKGWFSYTINNSPGKITVNTMFKIDHDIFLPEEYASLYAFFDRVLQKQNEKIVFVKE